MSRASNFCHEKPATISVDLKQKSPKIEPKTDIRPERHDRAQGQNLKHFPHAVVRFKNNFRHHYQRVEASNERNRHEENDLEDRTAHTTLISFGLQNALRQLPMFVRIFLFDHRLEEGCLFLMLTHKPVAGSSSLKCTTSAHKKITFFKAA